MITQQAPRRGTRRKDVAQPAVAAAATPARAAGFSPWILNRWRDLLLFVGTPAVLIPVFAAAQARWSAQDIFLFVGAFGAMGHHLPGMIRAYGDRSLFQRFRTRFIVAPLALLVVCIWASFYNVQAVQLVALTWGIWHGMMQTYGFCRIYDAKSGGRATARARTDLALCFTWFVAAVLLSPLRFRSSLELYYDSGGPVVPGAVISGIRNGAIVAVILVTLVFAWRQWIDFRQGRGGSAIKLALLTSSIAFWWYCNNGVTNILVGISLFEVFHDVQYLSIVWIYNRTRVERDESIRGFMRFVFRRSGSLMGVYVGLVLAYGSIALLSSGVSADWIRHALIGLVTASALLHFYYDGFIWKVREVQTGSVLGISGNGAAAARAKTLPPWFAHGVRWAALIIPFSALCAAQLFGRVVPPLERTAKVVEVLPRDPEAQLKLGKALHNAGRVDAALTHYQVAESLRPDNAETQACLGQAYEDLHDIDNSIAHYERAVELDPRNGMTQFNYAGVLAGVGKLEQAREHLERGLALDPKQFNAHELLADILFASRDVDGAIAHYEEALRLKPDFQEAREHLAAVRRVTGR